VRCSAVQAGCRRRRSYEETKARCESWSKMGPERRAPTASERQQRSWPADAQHAKHGECRAAESVPVRAHSSRRLRRLPSSRAPARGAPACSPLPPGEASHLSRLAGRPCGPPLRGSAQLVSSTHRDAHCAPRSPSLAPPLRRSSLAQLRPAQRVAVPAAPARRSCAAPAPAAAPWQERERAVQRRPRPRPGRRRRARGAGRGGACPLRWSDEGRRSWVGSEAHQRQLQVLVAWCALRGGSLAPLQACARASLRRALSQSESEDSSLTASSRSTRAARHEQAQRRRGRCGIQVGVHLECRRLASPRLALRPLRLLSSPLAQRHQISEG
jgi:hypothetical protein